MARGASAARVLKSQARNTAGVSVMTNARVVLTTVEQKGDADKLATELVERRLAACVNILGPIRSVYRWQQKVHNEAEYLLIIKTTAEQAAKLESVFRELHPYELPECVQLSIEGGSAEYLAWLAAEVSSVG
jgi:periplasmic divalent cation tolerance protein